MSNFSSKIVKYDLDNFEEATNTYVDFSIVNNNPQGKAVPLIFNDLRSSTLLENVGDYYLAVVCFHIDSAGLPVLIPQVQLNQPDPNLTEYSFTMQYGIGETAITSDQTYLNFVSEMPNESTPEPPMQKQDMSNKYYFITSYSFFIRQINATLKACYNNLNSKVALNSLAAFILYDPISSQCVFNADAAKYDTSSDPASTIFIYCNPQMYNLLSGFEWDNFGYDKVVNGLNYKLNLYNNYGTNILQLTLAGGVEIDVIEAYEEYESIVQWNPIQSVIFSSDSMPLVQTIVNDVQKFNSTTSMNINSSNNSESIITDFTIALDVNNRYVPSIDYVSPAQYRFVDLQGHGNIKALQLSVYWKDIYSNSYPLFLPSGGSSNLKLLFKRKDARY